MSREQVSTLTILLTVISVLFGIISYSGDYFVKGVERSIADAQADIQRLNLETVKTRDVELVINDKWQELSKRLDRLDEKLDRVLSEHSH